MSSEQDSCASRPRREKKLTSKAHELEEEKVQSEISATKRAMGRRNGASPARNTNGRAAPSNPRASTERIAPQRNGTLTLQDYARAMLERIELGGFRIYSWPYPPPKSFPTTSERHREWKRKQDALEESEEFEDIEIADDWANFCGKWYIYGPHQGDMERCIARTFVDRAKRAFRMGAPWSTFADGELAIDSLAEAKAEKDPEKRKLLIEWGLDNQLRLAVFVAIRKRLCTEIWLEEFSDQ